MRTRSVLVLYKVGDFSELISEACYNYVRYLVESGIKVDVKIKSFDELQEEDNGGYDYIYCTAYYPGDGIVMTEGDGLSVFKSILFEEYADVLCTFYEYRDFEYTKVYSDFDTYLLLYLKGELGCVYTLDELREHIKVELTELISKGEYTSEENKKVCLLYEKLCNDGLIDEDLSMLKGHFDDCYDLYKDYLGVRASLISDPGGE